ncbi:MAG: hypothetical protein H0U52_14610 [Chloroflexi bacterium]|nr:hypothetical protein [Chloroflexota bacterium]
MNDNRSLEHRLTSAYAVAPTDGFASTDRRLAALTAQADVSRWPRLGRPLRVGFALAATFMVLAGAAAGAMHLLDRVATGTPGLGVAWDQGVEIDERQVHGDYAVTLARGYADLNQVVLGLSVERVGQGRVLDVGLVPELRDPAGVNLAPGSAPSLGANDAHGVAELLTFAPTTSSDGDYTLRLGIPAHDGQPDLAWTFRFRLPAPAGAVVRVAKTQATDEGSVALNEVRLSPTMITASIHVEPSDREASGWSVFGYFKHGDKTVNIDWGTISSQSDLDLTAGTYAGTDDPAGAWTLVVTELAGDRPNGTQVRLKGPWEFSFSAP